MNPEDNLPAGTSNRHFDEKSCCQEPNILPRPYCEAAAEYCDKITIEEKDNCNDEEYSNGNCEICKYMKVHDYCFACGYDYEKEDYKK